MINLCNKGIEKYFPWIHAFGFFALFAMQMTQYYYCNFYAIWFPNRYASLAAGFTVLYYMIRRFRDGKEVQILSIYAVWVLLTRIISGYLLDEEDLLLSVGMFICVFSFALAYQFDYKKRQMLLNVFTIVFIGIITFVSAVGIYAALIQKPVDIKFFGKTLDAATFQEEGGVMRLRIADAHPNTSACWAFMCLFILINRLVATKSKLLKAIIIIAAVIDYLAMALTNCRTIFACFSICAAVLVYLLISGKLPTGKTSIKVICFVLSVVIIVPIAYKSVDLSLKGLNYLSLNTVPEGTVVEDNTLYENSREVIGEESTLKPRILIWKSAINTIRQQPERLLIGSSVARLGEVSDVSEGINFHVYHYHNMFVNVLMLTGIPGLVAVIVFLFVLVKKILILLFSSKKETALAEKTLTIPLIGFIGYGATLEVLLFTETDIRAFAFFFIAGIMLADYRDLEIGK